MSAVPQAQDELVTLLGLALPGTHVQFGLPSKAPKTLERVYVADETSYIRGGGEQYREETFGLRIWVEVEKEADDAKACSDRRWELIDAIDAALMADDFLGYESGGGRLSSDSSGVFPSAAGTGWIARSGLTVNVLARF